MSHTLVQVSQRSLKVQLAAYVLLAGVGGAVVIRGLSGIASYPLQVALSFSVTGLLLYPAYRLWKESRKHVPPSFLAHVKTNMAVALVIFAVMWLSTRSW